MPHWQNSHGMWSHPSRDVWIEIPERKLVTHNISQSHPSRDVWIEIQEIDELLHDDNVTSLTGCVD